MRGEAGGDDTGGEGGAGEKVRRRSRFATSFSICAAVDKEKAEEKSVTVFI